MMLFSQGSWILAESNSLAFNWIRERLWLIALKSLCQAKRTCDKGHQSKYWSHQIDQPLSHIQNWVKELYYWVFIFAYLLCISWGRYNGQLFIYHQEFRKERGQDHKTLFNWFQDPDYRSSSWIPIKFDLVLNLYYSYIFLFKDDRTFHQALKCSSF